MWVGDWYQHTQVLDVTIPITTLHAPYLITYMGIYMVHLVFLMFGISVGGSGVVSRIPSCMMVLITLPEALVPKWFVPIRENRRWHQGLFPIGLF